MGAARVRAQYGKFGGSKHGFGGLSIAGDPIREMVKFLQAMESFPPRIRKRAVKQLAHELMEESLKLAPDSGVASSREHDEDGNERKWDERGYRKLKESASVMERKGTWIVRYSTRHAAAQHERMDYQRTSGQAKYLEQPLMAMRSTFRERIIPVLEEEMAREADRKRRSNGSA